MIDSNRLIAMREIETNLRAELAEARKPNCRTCFYFRYLFEACSAPAPCKAGSMYDGMEPLRLYEDI